MFFTLVYFWIKLDTNWIYLINILFLDKIG